LSERLIHYLRLMFSLHNTAAHTRRVCGKPAVRHRTGTPVRAEELGLLEV
jgi:hypothetical protein